MTAIIESDSYRDEERKARLWKAAVATDRNVYVVDELVARDAAEAASEAKRLVRNQKLGGNPAVGLRLTMLEEASWQE